MKREFTIDISEKESGKEVKTILEKELECSANIISKLKTGDYILLNGKRVTVRERLSEGDVLKIILPEEQSDNIIPNPEINVDILYEDEDILVVNKQSGVPTHPSINHYGDTLANGIMNYFEGEFTFRAINRLDRETSGIVLIAKNILSAHLLAKQVKNREIEKIYYAVTENIPLRKEGVIEAPIKRECESIIKRCVADDGKEAKTIYKVMAENDKMALVMAEPVTGRTHQIRVHFSHIGCPLFGDRMYGSLRENERVRLHCKKLVFLHPITKQKLEIESPLPKDFNVI